MYFIKEWQQHRNLQIDLATVTPQDLGTHLRKFYAEVKAQNGKPLSPPSLRGIRAGIHRRIIGPLYNRGINIIEDREFQVSLTSNILILFSKTINEIYQ